MSRSPRLNRRGTSANRFNPRTKTVLFPDRCANGSRNCDTSVSQLPISKNGASSSCGSCASTATAISACVLTSPMPHPRSPHPNRAAKRRSRSAGKGELGCAGALPLPAMALQDTLGQSFSAGGFDLSQAAGQLTTAFGGIAPGGVDVDAQAVASLAATIAQADPTGAVGSVAQLAGKYGQTLSGLADPAHIGDAFTAAVDSIGSLGTHLAGLRTGLVGALTTTPPGDRPVDRFVAGTDPFRALHVGPLGAVLRTLAPGAVPSLPAGLTGIVPALLGQAA